MTNDELSNLDAVRIAHAVRTRELSAIDVVKAALARMDALESSVHAFCTATPELALETHAREELGIDPRALGRPLQAALSSFVTFGVGALIPLVPWFFARGTGAVVASLLYEYLFMRRGREPVDHGELRP